VESAHLTVSAAQTDDHVRQVVAALVRDPRVAAAMSPHVEADLAAGERVACAVHEGRGVSVGVRYILLWLCASWRGW